MGPLSRTAFALLLLLTALPVTAADYVASRRADTAFLEGLRAFRANADFRFRDRILSPLTEADRLTFEGLEYFEPAPELVLPARLVPARDSSTFAMPTFDGLTLSYSHYATVTTSIGGRAVRLEVFRREVESVVRDILLIPFRDATNGDETYPGGRYIEIDLPAPEPFVLDFNRAVNPLCAYDSRYACPIPPPENRLDFPIRAGEKRFD